MGKNCLRSSVRLRTVWAGVLFLALLTLATLSVGAADGETVKMPDGFDEAIGTLPDDALSHLPDGFRAESTDEQGAALAEMLTPQYWLDVAGAYLCEAFEDGVRLFALVCGLLILTAVFSTVRTSLSSSALQGAIRFCTVGGLFATVLHVQYDQLTAVAQFFDRLHTLMTAMVPVGGVLLAMGGNVMTATAGSATLGVFLSVSEGLCAKTVMPVCAIGTAFGVCSILSPELGLRGLASALRKTYTFILGLVMTLLCFLLSSQSAFCAAADSTGARTAKLISSMAIPVVGGSVGETLRTVAGSVQYLKSIVGIGGIACVALLLLPTLLSLLVTRLVLLLGSGVAELLGCESEGRVLSELGNVWGTMIAVVAMCSVMFIFALGIFVRVAVAVG